MMRDMALITAIIRREESAIGKLIDRYSRLLWSIAAAVLQNAGSEQDVEEVVADVFICLWQQPQKFIPERGNLKTLLCVMTRSRAIDRYRKLTRNLELPLEEAFLTDGPGMQELLEQKENRAALAAAVKALEEPNREILVRRYFYNQKPKQIALAMGLTVKQVDNALYRTKQQLRSRLTMEEVSPK